MNTEEQMLAAGFKRPVEMEQTEEQKQELDRLKLRFEELANKPQPIRLSGMEARIIPPSLNLTEESLDAIRTIVREELALLKQELVKDVLKRLETEIRLNAGMISVNEARAERGVK